MRLAASGSGFSVLLKNAKGIMKRMVQYSAYYLKCPWYYSESGSGFSLLLKNVQDIIQRMFQD